MSYIVTVEDTTRGYSGTRVNKDIGIAVTGAVEGSGTVTQRGLLVGVICAFLFNADEKERRDGDDVLHEWLRKEFAGMSKANVNYSLVELYFEEL